MPASPRNFSPSIAKNAGIIAGDFRFKRQGNGSLIFALGHGNILRPVEFYFSCVVPVKWMDLKNWKNYLVIAVKTFRIAFGRRSTAAGRTRSARINPSAYDK